MLSREARQGLEAAIEALIGLLDALDGDPDLEMTEDGGDQCDDEGAVEYECVPTYQGDVDGSLDQTRIVSYLNA